MFYGTFYLYYRLRVHIKCTYLCIVIVAQPVLTTDTEERICKGKEKKI